MGTDKKSWYKIDADTFKKIMLKHPEFTRSQAMRHYYSLLLPGNYLCCTEISAESHDARDVLRPYEPEIVGDQPTYDELQNIIHDLIDTRRKEIMNIRNYRNIYK